MHYTGPGRKIITEYEHRDCEKLWNRGEYTEHPFGHGTPVRTRNTCNDMEQLSGHETPLRTRNTWHDTEHLSGHGTLLGTRNTCQDMKHLSRYGTPIRTRTPDTIRNTCHHKKRLSGYPDLQAEIGGRNLPSPQQRHYLIDHDVLFPLQRIMLERKHEAKFRKIFPGCKARPQDKFELNIPNRLTNLLTHQSGTRAEISSLQTQNSQHSYHLNTFGIQMKLRAYAMGRLSLYPRTKPPTRIPTVG